MNTWGDSAGETVVAALPSASASSAVTSSPATPRTPSVPNSLRVIARPLGSACGALALRELRALTGLLETRLLALLHAGVAREEAVALELATEVRVGLDECARDAVPQRRSLSRDAAAVDLRHHVHAAVVARGLEREPRVPLEGGAREVDVEALAVDRVSALAGLEDHAGDGTLALACRAIAGVGGQLERRARGRGLVDRRRGLTL